MSEPGRVIALGTFDGVHMGHRELIATARAMADESGLIPMIYTFRNHPLTFFRASPPLIMTPAERMDTLSRVSGFEVVADEFDAHLANTPPDDFVDMLIRRFNMRGVVVGYNYSYGKGGDGDTVSLGALGEKLGFAVNVRPPVRYRDKPVSSTRIRAMIEAGEIADANAMLCSEYKLHGTVVSNRQIGRELGFPTANIADIGDKVMPAKGVYATRATIDGQTYMAVTNIGNNPTVKGTIVTIETHLMDFSADIYGKHLDVAFAEWLREERAFPGLEALSAQISEDTARARQILSRC